MAKAPAMHRCSLSMTDGFQTAAKAAGGGRDKHRSRRGSPDSYTSRLSGSSRSRGGRGRSPEGAAKFQQAAKAALLAGATKAFRVRNEPGGWGGAKGKRILTAAIGAGGIDAAADRDPEHKRKRHILETIQLKISCFRRDPRQKIFSTGISILRCRPTGSYTGLPS
jgi:hypothetical protein